MTRPLAALTLTILLATTAAADPAVEDIRAKVRAAVGYDVWAKLQHGILVTGTAKAHSATAPFTLHLHPDGRYTFRQGMPLGVDNGYDGKGWWSRAFTNPPLPADLFSRDEGRMFSGLLGHGWLNPAGGFTAELDPAEHRTYRPCLLIRHPDAPAAAVRIYVDPETWLPARFVVFVGRVTNQFEPSDWRVVSGAKVPARLVQGWHPGQVELVAASVAAGGPPPAGSDPFAPPPVTADTAFDPAAPARVWARFEVCHPDQWEVPATKSIALQVVVEVYRAMKDGGYGFHHENNRRLMSQEEAAALIARHPAKERLERWLDLARRFDGPGFTTEAEEAILGVELTNEEGNPRQTEDDPHPRAMMVFTVRDAAVLAHMAGGLKFDSAMCESSRW